MNDLEFMRYAFKGNEQAVQFVLSIQKIADVWDNLIDRDVPVSDEAIHAAFWHALIELPQNIFFATNQNLLLPLMVAGISNWRTATRMERNESTNRQGLEIAHVLRYSIADVAVMAAVITGGIDWSVEVGPEIRMRSQRSDFAEYLRGLPIKKGSP